MFRARPRHHAGTLAATLLAAFAAGSCAAVGGRSERSSAAAGDRVITGEELASISVSSAHDVLARLRPLWLRSAGPRSRSARLITEVVVVTNGQYFGNLSSLRYIPASTIREIRYLTGSEATNAFPWLATGRHVESAIVIAMGPGPGQPQEEGQ